MSPASKLKIPVSGRDHAQGLDGARLVLVEYGDYQCPYCGRAYPIVKRLQTALGKDLKFVFRNFPLTEIHPHALAAAKAAEGAGLQGKFWEMHDRLFENQGALDQASLADYAGALGLDAGDFGAASANPTVEERISDDFEGGVRSGVNGTPSFFVNGLRYDGDWSYGPFLKALKAELAEIKSRES
jgi:protein-disulfide isomerase